MEFTVHELDDQHLVEGAPGQPMLKSVKDVSTLIETCFEHAAMQLLLYSENLTGHS